MNGQLRQGLLLAILVAPLAGCGGSAFDPAPGEVTMPAAQLNGRYQGTMQASNFNCFRQQTGMTVQINGARVTGSWEGGMSFTTQLEGNGYRTELTARPANGGTYQISLRGKVQPGGGSMLVEFGSTNCTFSGTLTKR